MHVSFIHSHITPIFLFFNPFTHAHLTLTAVSTEVSESRLFWELVDNEGETTVAEFLCSRHGDELEFKISTDPTNMQSEPVVGGNRRRWVVRKVYLANEGPKTVEKWFVSSSVNYTCTEGRSRY